MTDQVGVTPPAAEQSPQDLVDLSGDLWRLREGMLLLAYRLEVQRALVETGRSSWLARATQEVDALLDEIRRTDLLRAVDSSAAATSLGLTPDACLAEIAAAAPDPWGQLLTEHRTELLSLSHALAEAAAGNSALLAAACQAVTDTLGHLARSETGTYTATGAAETGTPHRLFDLST